MESKKETQNVNLMQLEREKRIKQIENEIFCNNITINNQQCLLFSHKNKASKRKIREIEDELSTVINKNQKLLKELEVIKSSKNDRNIDMIIQSDREFSDKLSKFKKYLTKEGNCCSVKSCLKPFTPLHIDSVFPVFSKNKICVKGSDEHFGFVDVCLKCWLHKTTKNYGRCHTIDRDMVIL
jgi:hypothetical protein